MLVCRRSRSSSWIVERAISRAWHTLPLHAKAPHQLVPGRRPRLESERDLVDASETLMIDNFESGTIPLPLDPEQVAEILFEFFSEIELGEQREDGYRVIECTVDRDGEEIGFDQDLAVRLSLIVAPSLGIISLTFFSAVRDDVNLILLLKFLRRLSARGPQYNIAFDEDRVSGVSFDYDLRVVPNMPVSILVDTLIWFAKYVTMWHYQLNPHLLELDEERYWSVEVDEDEDEEEEEDSDDELFDEIELDDDDDDDERYTTGDVEVNF